MSENPYKSPKPDGIARPFWVGQLVGNPPAKAAIGFIVLSLLLALVGLYGFSDSRFFGFGYFLFAALMYGLSIRWMDRHGAW